MTATLRSEAPAAVKFRSFGDAGEGTFEGIASTGDNYPIGGGRTERIAYGAWAESVARQPAVPLFFSHDWSEPVGTAECRETLAGLTFKGTLFITDSDRARTLYSSLKAGSIRELSVGYVPLAFGLSSDPTEDLVTRADLLEISLCLRGMNPHTEVTAVRHRKLAVPSNETLFALMDSPAGRRRVEAYRRELARSR